MDSIEPLPFALVGRHQHQAQTLESLATPHGKWLAMAIAGQVQTIQSQITAVDSDVFWHGGFSHLHQFYTNLDSAKKSSAISYRIHGAAIYGVPWIPSIYPLYVSIQHHGSYGFGNDSPPTVTQSACIAWRWEEGDLPALQPLCGRSPQPQRWLQWPLAFELLFLGIL